MIGLSLLYFIYENKEVEEVERIEDRMDEDVKIRGIVRKVNFRDGTSFIEIEKKQLIPVVFFEEVSVEEEDLVEIIGRVTKYKGEYEIIGKEIKVSD